MRSATQESPEWNEAAEILTTIRDNPGIDETIEAVTGQMNDAQLEEPPILPELQHLNALPPPPPPPPPAPFGNRNDAESSSLSSNSNVGMIQMVLDNEPEDDVNVIEVPSLTSQAHIGDRGLSPAGPRPWSRLTTDTAEAVPITAEGEVVIISKLELKDSLRD